MADIPHFAVPFRVVGGKVATVEQDSDDDVLACVETVLRTPMGSRLEEPEFGLEDPTFTTSPELIEQAALDALHEWEPRAETIAEAEISNLIATLNIGVDVA